MANVYVSLADMVQVNDRNLADINVTDLLDDAPVMKRLFAVPASNGTLHKYLKQTAAPAVGFRDANDGRENKASVDTPVTVTLKILDASFAIDKALADSYKNGPEAMIDREGMRHLKAAFAEAEQQIFYGTGNDASGFAGLANNALFDALADGLVVNAGGTTASTGSSCWLIRTTEADTAVVAGNDGKIIMGDSTVQRIAGATTGFLPAYFTPITGWLGLQLGSAYSIVRIANLTADSGKGLTDTRIASALALFPSSRQPNLIACNRRSLEQLRASRTATNATGAPAPIPTEAFGIPIVSTDQIVSTETLLA